jgi:hypothetical protein
VPRDTVDPARRNAPLTSAAARAAALIPRVVGGGKPLADRLPRTTEAAAEPWPAARSTLAIVATALVVAAMWMDNVRLLIAAGPIAVIAVSALAIHQIGRARSASRVRALRAAHATAPWRWDHPWNERGARDDDSGRQAWHLVAWGVGLGVFATAFALVGLTTLIETQGARRLFALPFVAIGLLDVIAFRLLVDGARLTVRRLRYGRSVAVFDGFPFRRGETLRLYIEAPRSLPRHALPTATLRCVQERYVTTSTAEDSTTLRCFAVYEDTAAAEVVDRGPGTRALRVSFAVPANAPITDLASHPCRYWEVDIEAITDRVDYGARFLVPIY